MKLSSIRKIGISGASVIVVGILFHVLFPIVIDQEIKAKVSLEKGKLRRFIWDKPPFFLTVKFYMFNVTNSDAVMQGAKPILREIGPFAYDMVHENTNQIDNDTDDTISFNRRQTYFFNPEKSNGLTGDEEIVIANFFVLSSANFIARSMPGAVPILSKAIDSIFHEPSSIFIRAKVREILFDGLPIDCNVTDFAGSTVCGEIRASYKDFNMMKANETTYLYSLWGWQNGTDSRERLRVSRGIERIEDVGKVVSYAGKANMSVWNVARCDAIEGTDGSIFHPFFDDEGRDPLVLFAPDMCRTLRYQFHSKTQFYGIEALRYTTDIGVDGEHVKEHRCYCTDPYSCMKKGTFDMYKCIKLPIILTNPHFYLADPYYLGLIDGLEPDENKHTTYIDVDPLSGSPMLFSVKLQFNLMLAKLERFRLTSNVTDSLLPLIWIDEEFETPDFMMADLIAAHHLISLATVLKFITIIIGFGLSAYAVYLYYSTNTGGSDLVSKKVVQSVNNNPTGCNADGRKLSINLNTLPMT